MLKLNLIFKIITLNKIQALFISLAASSDGDLSTYSFKLITIHMIYIVLGVAGKPKPGE